MEYQETIQSIVESLLFISNEPLTIAKLCEVIGAEENDVKKALEVLEAEYRRESKGIRLRNVAGGYGLYTNPQNVFYIDRLVQLSSTHRLTQAALEVLSIIAYRQPITRAQINNVRGVNSETVLNSLIDKGLIREKGRDKIPGMPILYEVTRAFLEALGINDIGELPHLEQFAPDTATAEQIREQLFSGLSDSSPDTAP